MSLRDHAWDWTSGVVCLAFVLAFFVLCFLLFLLLGFYLLVAFPVMACAGAPRAGTQGRVFTEA